MVACRACGYGVVTGRPRRQLREGNCNQALDDFSGSSFLLGVQSCAFLVMIAEQVETESTFDHDRSDL